MKVYVCEIYDNKLGEHHCVGIDFDECSGGAYESCMREMNNNQYFADRDRFEFFCTEEDIDFQWDMSEEQFKTIMQKPNKWLSHNYLGSVFFGNCKLEFVHEFDGKGAFICCNLFVREREGYGNLWDGTPYDSCEGFACQIENDIPKRRTLDAFARHIEHNIVESLNEYYQLIDSALMQTEPNAWYSIEHVLIKPTRRA